MNLFSLDSKKCFFLEGLEQAAYTLCLAVLRGQDGDLPSQVLQILVANGLWSRGERDTDIDEKNMNYAKRNIVQNSLKSRIRPLKTKPNDPLIPLDAFGLKR